MPVASNSQRARTAPGPSPVAFLFLAEDAVAVASAMQDMHDLDAGSDLTVVDEEGKAVHQPNSKMGEGRVFRLERATVPRIGEQAREGRLQRGIEALGDVCSGALDIVEDLSVDLAVGLLEDELAATRRG